MYQGDVKPFINFSGGLVTNRPNISLSESEAMDADNVIVLPNGKGIANCRGNTAFNSSAMNSGAAVQGLGYFRQSDQDEWLLAVCGNKLYKADALDGTMDDITGSLTITSGADYKWDIITFGDAAIGFGGLPNAPWRWTSAGNAAALAGTPPTADFAFTYNNRVFAGIGATSTIYWSIVGNAADWTGVGSGSGVVGSLEDNQLLVGGCPLTVDQALLFKEESIYSMSTRYTVNSAFPIFPVHNSTGAAGKHSIVNVDGEIYFITPKARMMSTNGSRLKDYPADIDDIWNGLNFDRLKFIEGFHDVGVDHDWLVWMCSNGSSTTNSLAIVWDLENQCWLQRTTGLNANSAAITIAGTLYTGHYDGKIYVQDVAGTYTQASESAAVVSWYWRTGWLITNSVRTIRPVRVNLNFKTVAAGTLNFKVGFDFDPDRYTKAIDMSGGSSLWDVMKWDQGIWGSATFTLKPAALVGRGNAVQFELDGSDAIEYQVGGFFVAGHLDVGQKVISAP